MKTVLHNWHIDQLSGQGARLSLSGTSLENCLENLSTGSDVLLGITEDRYNRYFLCEDIEGNEFILPWGSMRMQDFRSDERAHEFYAFAAKRYNLSADAFDSCIAMYNDKVKMYENEAKMLLKSSELYIAIDEYDIVYAATRNRGGRFSQLFANYYADDRCKIPLSTTKYAANCPPDEYSYGGITISRCSRRDMYTLDEQYDSDIPDMPCYGLLNWVSRLKVAHIRANCCDDFILSCVSNEFCRPIWLNLSHSCSSLISLRRSDYFGG